MPLEIIRNDITKMRVDAIVNAANPTLLGGGGVDGAIHSAAGPCLLDECAALGGCEVGGAVITKGYDLPCEYVIHAVGPIWRGGGHGERRLLASCYRAALALAKAHDCATVAFPLISSGAYGYPKDKALKVAVDEIGGFLLDNDMTIYIVIFDSESFSISAKLFTDISQYIDDVYADAHAESILARLQSMRDYAAPSPQFGGVLDNMLEDMDEGFARALFRKIDERGMSDVECYKRANIDRKLFSKIKSNARYQPSKPTALAFAIALKLSLNETRELIMRAGYALSRSSKFDIIIEYCILNEIWNINEVNEILFSFDQSLLGAG